MTNRLKITTGDIEFTLEGDTDYVERAYAAVRDIMLERFVEAIHAGPPPEPDTIRTTMPMNQISDENTQVSIISCNEVYHKIHLVDRVLLEKSEFSRIVDFKGVGRVYVNREQQERFKGYFPFGKVLWRELTSAGRAAIRSSK